MLLLAATVVFGAACRNSKKPDPTPTALATASATATSAPPPLATPAAVTDLASLLGVRASLLTNDPIDLAARYGKTPGRAAASKPFAGEPAAGSTRDFIAARITGAALAHRVPPELQTITATLSAMSKHAYFYVDTALEADADKVQEAADKFESIWPVVTGVYGEPASPGVDGDPRIIVLQADLGGAIGGYFSGDDLYLRSVRPLSNEAEMVYIDRTLTPGGESFNVVLAHEFQHLIHAKNDTDEEAWVNEGLSEDSSMLVGGAVSSIKSFAARPETQLNFWDSAGSLPHYGAGAAFFRYLASRFGGDPALGAIAREPGDGTAGIDGFLASIGQSLRFRDVFADWIVANVLNRDSGPYGNPGRAIDIPIDKTLAPGDPVNGDAREFGTDYYSLPDLGGGEHVLRFQGATAAPVLPPGALSQGAVMWANGEDDINTRLTREVDLTGAVEPVLTFRTWFDIERWFDWGYVSVSADGGATWQALPGYNTSTDDPTRIAYGPGFTGQSGGGTEAAWIDERVSLAPFAGEKVLLRLEYVTDGGTHGEGWAVRDVAIEGTSFRDAELTDPGWRSEGWVRIDRPLAQTYIVRLIASQEGAPDVVRDVPLDAGEGGELRFNADGLQDVVVAIAGGTEGTNQTTRYTIELLRP